MGLFVAYDLEVFITMLLCFLMAWLFHEAMHYIVANKYKLRPFYGYDHRGSFISLEIQANPNQQRKILEAAVIMGCLPILVAFFSIGAWIVFPLMLYVVGCASDLKSLRDLRGIK